MSKDLEASITKILNEWEDDFTTDTERTMQTVALETVKRLRETKSINPGEYTEGWTAENKAGIVTVYNAAKPSLTHLLEYGHENPTAITGKKRTPAHPHIAKAEAWASEELIRRIKEL